MSFSQRASSAKNHMSVTTSLSKMSTLIIDRDDLNSDGHENKYEMYIHVHLALF